MADKIVKVHIGAKRPPVVVDCAQYDEDWQFHFQVFYNDQRWTIPAGSIAFLVGKKPDGHVFAFLGTLENNEVVVDCDVQMTACAGMVSCEVRILTPAAKSLATPHLFLDVAASPEGRDDVVSNTAITAYAEVLQQLETGVVIDYQRYLSDLQEAFESYDAQFDETVEEAEETINGYLTQAQGAAAAAEQAKQYAQAYTGAPRVAATAAGMTDHALIYVYTGSETGYTNGHWYYWDGSSWADGGVYNSIAFETDDTLSIAGKAADAAATGSIKSSIFDSFRVLTDASIWSQGGIRTSTGVVNTDATNRICTAFIKRKNLRYLSAPSGYKYIVSVYSDATTSSYISGYNSNKWIKGTKCITDINEEYYIRITLAYDIEGISTDPDILPSEGDKLSFYYGTDTTLTQTGVAADAHETGIIKTALDADYAALNDGKLLWSVMFERGNIDNTGDPKPSDSRIRSVKTVVFDEDTTYNIAEGFQIKPIRWNRTTGNLVASTAYYTGTYTFTTQYIYKVVIVRSPEDVSEVADIETFAKALFRYTPDKELQEEIAETRTYIDDMSRLMPYGLEPFQLSLFKQPTNLFSEFCYHISGGYYREQNDPTKRYPRISATSNWQGWLIRVKPSTTYALGQLDFKLQFLDVNGLLDVEFTGQSDTDPNIVTSGSNSYWMCLTQRIGRDMSDWMMVEGDTYPSEYISGHPQWVAEPKKSITEKTIAFFGDSITAGSGITGLPDSQSYHQYIHDLYGYICLNYAYGGSGYVKDYQKKSDTPGHEEEGTGLVGLHGQGNPGRGYGNRHYHFWPNNVGSMIARMSDTESEDDLTKIADPTSLDAVVIFAGTNDWSNNIPLEDFATGVDTVFNYYHAHFGAVPLLVMTPIHRINDTTSGVADLSEYVDIIIQKCREHGIPYIDTFTMSGIQPNNESNRAIFFPRDDGGNDGVHPNHLAHQRIARAIGETLNQIVLWNENVMR